jgi:hypothetical protein
MPHSTTATPDRAKRRQSAAAHKPPLSATEEQALLDCWAARCRSGEFSPGVKGIGVVRVFGRAGDVPVQFPQVRTLGDLDGLAPDERFALDYAQRAVDAYRARRRAAIARARDGGSYIPVEKIDPLADADIVIVAPITGG